MIIRLFKFTILLIFLSLTFIGALSQNTQEVSQIKGLRVGDKAPEFTGLDVHLKEISSTELLRSGPLVVVFFRGQWCPYCNKHLSQIQDSIQYIKSAGANLITISPEKPEYGEMTVEKTEASFPILYDEDYKIASAFDVLFKPTSGEIFKYNTFVGAELKKAHSGEDQNLPIPATFVINQEGIIIWRHFDPDYKTRSSVKEILSVLYSGE